MNEELKKKNRKIERKRKAEALICAALVSLSAGMMLISPLIYLTGEHELLESLLIGGAFSVVPTAIVTVLVMILEKFRR